MVGQHLFLNTIPNNSTAETERKRWCGRSTSSRNYRRKSKTSKNGTDRSLKPIKHTSNNHQTKKTERPQHVISVRLGNTRTSTRSRLQISPTQRLASVKEQETQCRRRSRRSRQTPVPLNNCIITTNQPSNATGQQQHLAELLKAFSEVEKRHEPLRARGS